MGGYVAGALEWSAVYAAAGLTIAGLTALLAVAWARVKETRR